MSRCLSLLPLLVATSVWAEVPLPDTVHLSSMTDAERAYLATRTPTPLKDVLALVDRNSKDLAAARANAAQVAAKARLVYSAILPELSLSATYVRTTAEQKFDLSSFAPAFEGIIAAAIYGTGPSYGLQAQASPEIINAVQKGFTDEFTKGTSPTVIVAKDSLYANVLLQQILFTPQFWLIPAADEAKDAAHFGTLEAREQVLLGVARLYLGIEGLAQIEQAARDAEQVALKRERDAKAQQQLGVATDIAVLRAQSETAQARATLATLSGQRVALLAMLEALTGAPVSPIEGQATKVEVTPGAESDAPWSKTWVLKATSMAIASQERFNTYDRLAWMPVIVGQLKGSYNSNKGFAGTNYAFDGIIAAQWSLYDHGMRYATLHENDAKTAELRAKLDAATQKARAGWLGAKTNLEAAQVALDQAEAQAALAARAQKQVESAYQAGFSTSLEVSDIDNKRFFAASGAAQARAQLEIRKVELAAAEGRLAESMGLGRDP